MQGGISLLPPPKLAPGPPRLPPMLHSTMQCSMTSYSKGAWGLFVLLRGLGILTETAISPSTWSRQCPSRYAIRAGRNLPDKEFRLIVLAACRHAVRTLPSPTVVGVWRQVSEDLDQVRSRFLAVHLLDDAEDIDQSLTGPMSALAHASHDCRESLEIESLRCA
jgi:hypothetical protein